MNEKKLLSYSEDEWKWVNENTFKKPAVEILSPDFWVRPLGPSVSCTQKQFLLFWACSMSVFWISVPHSKVQDSMWLKWRVDITVLYLRTNNVLLFCLELCLFLAPYLAIVIFKNGKLKLFQVEETYNNQVQLLWKVFAIASCNYFRKCR